MTKKTMKEYFIQARDKAVKAGYNYAIESQDTFSAYQAKVLLDKNFWVALGKSLEDEKKYKVKGMWGLHISSCCGAKIVLESNHKKCINCNGMEWDIPETTEPYLYRWHSFIDQLAEGKTPEEFFKELLKDERN